MGRVAGKIPACGACELGRARWHLERAAEELEEARVAWGCWADGIRQLSERHLGVADFADDRVLDDSGYGRALDMGAAFDEAVSAAGMALQTAAGGEDARDAGCPCLAVKAQIGSPHP